MKRYLIVAHQTATSPELLRRVQELHHREGGDASFDVLVPATPIDHLLTWEEGETHELARRRASDAREMLRKAGMRTGRATTGDPSPLLAIADELRARPGHYDAVVLSTLPPATSRWMGLGVRHMAAERFSIPMLHVHEDGDAEWRASLARLAMASRHRDEQAATTAAGRLGRFGMRDVPLPVLLVVMAAYLAGAATLALTVDRRFFVNDVFALAVFGGLLAWLLIADRPRAAAPAAAEGSMGEGEDRGAVAG